MFGDTPGIKLGRVAKWLLAVVMPIGRPDSIVRMRLYCHPEARRPMRGLVRKRCPAPKGRSYNPERVRRWVTSMASTEYSALGLRQSCGLEEVDVPSAERSAKPSTPSSMTLPKVYAPMICSPCCTRLWTETMARLDKQNE